MNKNRKNWLAHRSIIKNWLKNLMKNHNDELANIIEILKQDKTFSNIAFTLPIVEKSIMDEYASCINIIHDEFYSPS